MTRPQLIKANAEKLPKEFIDKIEQYLDKVENATLNSVEMIEKDLEIVDDLYLFLYGTDIHEYFNELLDEK